MIVRYLTRFALLMLSFAVLTACDKDEDENENGEQPTSQHTRTSTYSFTVSGDFEGEYELSVVQAGGLTGGVASEYDPDNGLLEFVITAVDLPENGSWGMILRSVVSPLAPGEYAIGGIGASGSNFNFADNNTAASFEVDSGTISITDVEIATPFAPGVGARYVNATFTLEMSNNSNETASVVGQITDGWVVVYD